MLYEVIFISLCLIKLKPVNDDEIPLEDMKDVIINVFKNPYSSGYPQYNFYAKIAWIIGVLAGLGGFNRIFCLYGLVATALLGTFGTINDVPDWDFVWLVSLSVSAYFVSFYFGLDIWLQFNQLYRSKVSWWKLCFLPLLLLFIWSPVSIENSVCNWDFSWKTLISNDAGTSFSLVATTLLLVLFFYHPYVDRSLFGVLTFVTSVFNSISLFVSFNLSMRPLVILYSLALFVSIVGYLLYFLGPKVEIKANSEADEASDSKKEKSDSPVSSNKQRKPQTPNTLYPSSTLPPCAANTPFAHHPPSAIESRTIFQLSSPFSPQSPPPFSQSRSISCNTTPENPGLPALPSPFLPALPRFAFSLHSRCR